MRLERLNEPWFWTKEAKDTIAAFVTPECARQAVPPLDAIDGRTVHDLRAESSDNSVIIARSIYDHLAEIGIHYDKAGYSPDQRRQRIRKPAEMVRHTRGTCLDAALLFAGFALNHQLRPVIIVFDDHAIAGFATPQFGSPIRGTFEDPDHLIRLTSPDEIEPRLVDGVSMSTIVPIECVGFTKGNAAELSFDEAIAHGRRKIASKELRFVIDPAERHARGIDPADCSQQSPKRTAAAAFALLCTFAVAAALSWSFMLQPGVTRMPDNLDGRNIAVLPFETTGDVSGAGLANGLTDQLKDVFRQAGELRGDSPGWQIWGPTEFGSINSYAAARTDVAELLRERNATIGIYGTVAEQLGGRVTLDLKIWFLDEADIVREAGIKGPHTFFRSSGVQASESRLIELILGDTDPADPGLGLAWLRFFQGLDELADATNGIDVLQAASLFRDAAAFSPEQTDGLWSLARLLEGGMYLWARDFLPGDDERGLAEAEARRAFDEIEASEGSVAEPLIDRARLANAQVDLATSDCSPGGDTTGLDSADAAATAIVRRVPLDDAAASDPAEVGLRATLMLSRIDYCHFLTGATVTSQMLNRVEQTIEHVEARTASSDQARVTFLVATAYFIRSEFDTRNAELDLRHAYCSSRNLNQDRYLARLRFVNPSIQEATLCEFS